MNIQRGIAHAIDNTATALARVVMSRSEPNANTLDQLHLYSERSIDALFEEEPIIPEMKIRERRGVRGFRWTNLNFASASEPLSDPFREKRDQSCQANERVHARWIRHTDGQRRPTMVFLHSWMATMSWFEDVALLPMFARRMNVDVLSMHLPYHGRRKPKMSAFHGEYFWTADLVRTFEALRQSVHDARSLIAWVQREDPGPVGVMGVSLGGMVALALSAFEPSLQFAIPIAAHLDLAGVLEDAALLKPVRKELEEHGWQPSDVKAYTRSLGLHEVMPCIPKERILFVVGKYDRILRPERSEVLWQRWGRPAIHRFPAGHLGILTHIRGILDVGREFVDNLHLAPTPAFDQAELKLAM